MSEQSLVYEPDAKSSTNDQPIRLSIGHLLIWTLVMAMFQRFPGGLVAAEPAKTGETIYKSLCISCHGVNGAGTKNYPEPLIGDRSVLELTRLIERTMPEDDPKKCVGEDARLVAAYIHETFYSPTAQARNQPLRVELARLTVRQYQQSLADLIGGFRGGKFSPGETRGLKGEYFAGRGFNGQSRAIDRVDATIDFDFGEQAPAQERFDPTQFSIRWQGSVLAPETAEYEFIVRTEHAARLWVNDAKTPLIDAWVKSGKDTEFRGSIKLLGGRAYPLKLEYSKAKQGVDDSKTKKPPVVKSSIALLWKLPRRTAEIVPQRALVPATGSETFVVNTPFPPDDRSIGYERGTSISKVWDQATTEGALETVAYLLPRIDSFAGTSEKASDRREKLREFCLRFAERAFRRPLSDEQKTLYVDRQFAAGTETEAALKRCLLLILKSPRFLYREPGSPPRDPYDVAARLAFGLWDSLPDPELLRAAAAGELATREQRLAQAERMLGDLRARAKVHEFFAHWLKIDQVPDLAKDSSLFPQFTPEIASDLRTSLELFLDETFWSEASDYRQLLLSNSFPLNERLLAFYRSADDAVPGTKATQFTSEPLDPEHRAGLLTHPYVLASLSYTANSSPIHRGVLISRSLLGRALKTPPEAVAPLAADLHPSLTTRERVVLQTKAEACHSCHAMINPLGFSLENFDAVGRFRATENGKPIDAQGEYLTRDGKRAAFSGPRELANFLATSDEAHAAFVSQLFHHFIKQPIRAYGPTRLPDLQSSFRQNQYNMRKLLAEVVVGAADVP